ncbi:MAG: VOC family protein [Muribaculaceae bacterium]|nr:VOC family protein [Muribaculaceae bacterium]
MTHSPLDHIGYLTSSIADSAREFELLGYQASPIFNDDTQRTRICMLTRTGDVAIELVEPYENNKTMARMLKSHGVAPYHLCYRVVNIEQAYDELIEQGWTALFAPVPATAFNGRKICYFWKREMGFMELVEE